MLQNRNGTSRRHQNTHGTDKKKINKQQKNETKAGSKHETVKSSDAQNLAPQTTKADKNVKTEKTRTQLKETQKKTDINEDKLGNNALSVSTDKQTEVILKIMNITKSFQDSDQKQLIFPTTDAITVDFNDSDIDPMLQTTPQEHKRVQRKLLQATITEQRDKNKTNVALTNSSTPSRVANTSGKLRQYQNRPSYTKTPQKVIVDSQNGDNQYEIEINIRQTNKNRTFTNYTQIVDYTNGYKPNYIDRFGTNYAETHTHFTPTINLTYSSGSFNANQRTKPPTIILVNEQDHEPGFASANGADSTFSFNIRHKPDKTQQNVRPSNANGGYGLAVPPRNPWTNGHPDYTPLDLPYRENINTPFSTANSQTYYIRNKNGPQRKEALALTPQQQFTDYDYLGRTLEPLSNVSSSELNEDKDLDYEYDEDYGISPFVRKFNRDGYLRPEHMIATVFKNDNDKLEMDFINATITGDNNQTLNDNYVMPMLNNSTELPKEPPPLDLPKPLLTNKFSTEYNDTLAKHFNNDIFAEDDNKDEDVRDQTNKFVHQHAHKRKRNKNKSTSLGRIAMAPINVLTKPERPDNWVFFDTPKEEEEPMLPRTPELKMEPIVAAEIPKPFKENIWLDLAKIKRKHSIEFPEPINTLKDKQDVTNEKTTDSTDTDRELQPDNRTKDKNDFHNSSTVTDLTEQPTENLKSKDSTDTVTV
ncbi:hypothetical protein DOY81_011267 [Sarcophaga bullata]|nr:hypothetical protein DOY81_011267 [Sarcophaga bullata]